MRLNQNTFLWIVSIVPATEINSTRFVSLRPESEKRYNFTFTPL